MLTGWCTVYNTNRDTSQITDNGLHGYLKI